MSRSKGKSNFGTLLQIGSGETNETFTTIAEIRLINAPEKSTEDVEITHHGSEGYREYTPSGLKDPSEVAMEMNSVPSEATQAELMQLEESGDVRTFKIVRPNGITETFPAYVKSIVTNAADAQSPDAIIDTLNLRLTGACTRTYVAPSP